MIAFLALRGRTVRRDLVAGLLWPHASESRAHASLRAALARLGRASRAAVRADALDISLESGASVDLRDAERLARRVLDPAIPVEPRAAGPAIAVLSARLLPGWYDDWVLVEAEQWRQLRLHALEALAASLTAMGSFADGATAAAAAVSIDPLRETARAALISVHLAEGNQSEALREFERYRRQLGADLGLEPTGRLRALLPAQAVTRS